MYEGALAPYLSGEMSQVEALEQGSRPIRQFMISIPMRRTWRYFTRFLIRAPRNAGTGTVQILIPAFVLSELKSAFQLGFVILFPYRHRYGGGIDVNGHGVLMLPR